MVGRHIHIEIYVTKCKLYTLSIVAYMACYRHLRCYKVVKFTITIIQLRVQLQCTINIYNYNACIHTFKHGYI